MASFLRWPKEKNLLLRKASADSVIIEMRDLETQQLLEMFSEKKKGGKKEATTNGTQPRKTGMVRGKEQDEAENPNNSMDLFCNTWFAPKWSDFH